MAIVGIHYIGVSPNFKITVVCGLKFYLEIPSLKFQKATSKIEVFWSLPCLAWGPPISSLNRAENGTSILLVAFCNFKLKVLQYPPLPETVDFSGALGGKTGKTSVLPGFSKIKCGSGSGGALHCYCGLT